MIERDTIKVGPAVSQKELEKALHEPGFENDAAISHAIDACSNVGGPDRLIPLVRA